MLFFRILWFFGFLVISLLFFLQQSYANHTFTVFKAQKTGRCNGSGL